MTNLTEKELEVLKAIDFSDYGQDLDEGIWGWDVSDSVGGTKVFSGVASSLVKKGLIGTQEDGEGSIIWMTPEGIKVYTQAVGGENVNKSILKRGFTYVSP